MIRRIYFRAGATTARGSSCGKHGCCGPAFIRMRNFLAGGALCVGIVLFDTFYCVIDIESLLIRDAADGKSFVMVHSRYVPFVYRRVR